ncbi:actin-associated protein FAM107A isoform X4 [Pimephales promelas]|uniref:actin-associated protein FAM107A isoform X4 n=1 Tax=Pimephales promelas TaxID=90988 RepID=UPI001955B3A6|nr:actin-associated protein FAM107A isoform X4 [Pimephales promelas]
MRSATAQTLPTRPSEQELKNALSNCAAGHNHNSSRPAQSRAKTSTDTVNCTSLHHHGHNRDKCDIAEGPWNLNNPVKASRSHQELHKELLLAHKKRDRGLVVGCKPELQAVLERRKREKSQREEGEQSRSPLEQKEKEDEEKLHEEIQLLEFVRVRQNLKRVHTALQKNIHS